MNGRESIVLNIRSLYQSFTKADKKIADTILKSGEEIIYDSITGFAERCGVSEASIVRFCRRIGASGYHEFRLMLASERRRPEESIHEGIEENDTLSTLIKKISEENMQAINNTMKLLSVEALEKAVELITKARKVEVYGTGESANTAMDVMYKFKRIGLPVFAYTDSHIQSMSAALLGKEDVAVGISFSGTTSETVEALAEAKKAGTAVICITNHAKSTITRYADVVLLSSVKETPYRSVALTSKIAQLHILDLLYTAVAMNLKEKALLNIQKTTEAVIKKVL